MAGSRKQYLRNNDTDHKDISKIEYMVKIGLTPEQINIVFPNTSIEALAPIYIKYFKSALELNAEFNRRHFFADKKYAKIKNLLRSNIRSQIADMFVRNINKDIEKIVGYSLDELMIHLESTFTEGMSWDNKGFDLKNIRALWAKDNLKKGSTYNG